MDDAARLSGPIPLKSYYSTERSALEQFKEHDEEFRMLTLPPDFTDLYLKEPPRDVLPRSGGNHDSIDRRCFSGSGGSTQYQAG